jgi:hypothetical protein
MVEQVHVEGIVRTGKRSHSAGSTQALDRSPPHASSRTEAPAPGQARTGSHEAQLDGNGS